MEGADTKKLIGALLHYFDGRLDRDAVLAVARGDKDMERLNMAEANFYIGQLFAVRRQGEEARRWFRRAVEQGALSYREHIFAQRALTR